MRTGIWVVLLAWLLAAPVAAQDTPVPERRLVMTENTDFYGSDIAQLFDTTLAACQRACLSDPACGAFTFNRRSNACFPKSAAGRVEPFEGAVSAWVRQTDPAVLARAPGRRDDLDFLAPDDIRAAREQAEALAARHITGQWSADEHLAAAFRARGQGDLARAAGYFGAALNLTDAADGWVEYGRTLLEVPLENHSARRDHRLRAQHAAVNGYLRAHGAAVRVSALVLLAEALEANGRGRDMIPALRLAQALQSRDDTAALLEEAVGKYGFRITGHEVQNEPARARICAQFSEPLAPGVEYSPFVQIAAEGLAVEAEDRQLCLEGVQHGARYAVTFRSGLPAASGEVLATSVDMTLYVRDRPASVRFPGRAYVLPAAGPIALPVETVNTEALELRLSRVSDRNLIRSMQEELFARPIAVWQQEQFAADIAEEVWRGTADVAMELNRDISSRLPLDGIDGGLEPGVYVLRAAIPGTDPWDTPAATQWFVVSDLGITSLSGVDGLHVVVRSLADGSARQGAEVRLIARSNRVLGTAETDALGHAVFPAGLARGTGNAAPALLTVTAGARDMAFLSLSEPEFDLSDRGVEGREPAPPVDLFLTTERGAYRAGETVHLTALARDAGGAAITGLPLTARLIRPDGVEYSRALLTEAGAGGHTASLPVAGSAPRGVWRLEVLADVEAPALAARTLLVEDFLPERIDFDLALPDRPLRLGDTPEVTLDARYLFGAVAAGLPVEGEVVLRAAEALAGFPGFVFGRHDDPFRPVFDALPPDLATGADGSLRFAAALPQIDDPARPLDLELRARVSEGSGRPVERRLVQPLAPSAPVLGIRPLFDDVVPEGAEAGFQVVAVGPDGQAVPAELAWRIDRVVTRYQWYQMYGQWNWEPVTSRSRVAEGTLGAGDSPVALSAAVDWGRYELIVERVDGPYAAASMAFNAGWYATGDVIDTPDMLEASLDAASYAVGDTARLRIVPRHAGTALVTVLSNRLIHMEVAEVGAGETVIDLPVTDDWGAGAYVAASVLRPMDAEAGRSPARALGLAHAAVDPGPRRLSAAFEMAPEAAPRAAMDVALRVEGLAEGDTALATIAAVDLGILNLTGFASPDPEEHYFGQRKLGVGIRDIYGRLIDATQGAMGTVRSGGDAGAAARLQAPPPTEDLVAWFSGPVTVGPDGMARTSLDLPAFNGTVRLMAVVWSDRAVGQAEADILVRDPVVVQASLPRFLAPGDGSRLRLELTHASGPAGRMGLDVSAPAGLDLGRVPSGLDLAEGGRAVVEIPVTAKASGVYRVTVALATPEGRTLSRTLSLPAQTTDPVVTRTSRFTLDPGQGFTLDANAFAGLVPGSGSATLAVGPMARFDAAGLLSVLDRYPYGCTEQVASAALPLLYLSDLAQTMGLGHAADLQARIDRAVGDVLLNQSSGGGFGLWAASSGDLWLDAFVTDFLSRARAQDHAVPETAFRMALDNLRNRINYAPDFDEGGAPYAYALMVLAREGAAAVGDLRYYADVKPHAFDTPLAAGQLGAALASYGDPARADAMFARAVRLLEASAQQGPVWRADYGTHLRDTAGLLALAAEAGSTAVDLERLAVQVAQSRPDRVSTQEAVWTLLAAHALIDRPGAEGFTLDGAALNGPLLRLTEDQTAGGAERRLVNGSDRAAEITLTTFGVPAEPEPASGNGYRIDRRYFTLEGEPVDPSEVATGTRLVAVLEVTPFEARQARLMVDDALPAGFEIDNPNLLRSGDIRALQGLGLLAQAEATEFRQDRFLAAVDWGARESFRLGYVVRAVSPGSYHHPAALVEDMYRPTLRARSAPGRVIVTD